MTRTHVRCFEEERRRDRAAGDRFDPANDRSWTEVPSCVMKALRIVAAYRFQWPDERVRAGTLELHR